VIYIATVPLYRSSKYCHDQCQPYLVSQYLASGIQCFVTLLTTNAGTEQVMSLLDHLNFILLHLPLSKQPRTADVAEAAKIKYKFI
jgi:hypothetical protein